MTTGRWDNISTPGTVPTGQTQRGDQGPETIFPCQFPATVVVLPIEVLSNLGPKLHLSGCAAFRTKSPFLLQRGVPGQDGLADEGGSEVVMESFEDPAILQSLHQPMYVGDLLTSEVDPVAGRS